MDNDNILVKRIKEVIRDLYSLRSLGVAMGAGGSLTTLLVWIAYLKGFDDVAFLTLGIIAAALFVVGGEIYTSRKRFEVEVKLLEHKMRRQTEKSG